MPGERVLHIGRIHWFVFVRAVLLAAVAGVLFNVQDEHGVAVAAAAFFTLFAAISLVRALILKISTELAVTNRRLIVKLDLVGRRTMELGHDKVEGVSVQQGVLGRVFGFGTLVVSGAGGGRASIRRVRRPHDFRRHAVGVAGGADLT
jgi:uncharacterized membrane protein YdbT with pleckstrin-like domain